MKKEVKHFDLDNTLSPGLVKTLKYDELEVLCEDIRKNLIQTCSINGGHLSSNLGVVELTVALHKVFNFPNDKVIFDVGHQCYTHKILSGRPLKDLRKSTGVAGFQRISESEYDVYDAGHSSTSISAAMGLALARDLNKENYQVISVIGDSSFANGLSFEAINHLANFKHKVIVIINDNERAISPSEGLVTRYFEKLRLSKRYLRFKEFFKKIFRFKITKPIYWLLGGIKNLFKYTLIKNNSLRKFGIYYISNIDGHDIKDMDKAFKYALNAPGSVIIHVTTTKGKGYKYAENDQIGHWHGVEPFDIETGHSVIKKDEDYISWSDVYSSFLKNEMEINPRLVLVNPGTTVGSKMNEIFEKHKERCFDVGIAEEHAAVFASAVALGGYKPYYSVYSTFLQRAYDEISHDVARLNADVTLLIDRCGMPNGDGETHQGVFDVAYLNSIPNFAIAMGKDIQDAKALFDFSLIYDSPFAIRYPRGGTLKQESINVKLKLGQWNVLQEGNDLALISYGPIVNDLINRYEGIKVINALFQRPIDNDVINSLLSYKDIVIYDIYGTKEGFASFVIETLISKGYKGEIHVKAIDNSFIQQGSTKEQLLRCGLDLESLDELIKGIK